MFHLQYNTSDSGDSSSAHDITFKEVEKGSAEGQVLTMSGRHFLLIGGDKDIPRLFHEIETAYKQREVSPFQLKALLQKMGAKEASIKLPEIAHKASAAGKAVIPSRAPAMKPGAGPRYAPPSSWTTSDMAKLSGRRKAIAEKYWEMHVLPGHDHAGLKDFLLHITSDAAIKRKIEEGFDTAIKGKDLKTFVSFFNHLTFDQLRLINTYEDLNAIPFLPITHKPHTITRGEIQNLKQFMEDKGFSGVVSISDGKNAYTIRSKKINNSKIQERTDIPFSMHSVAKMITCTAVLELIRMNPALEKMLTSPVSFDASVKLPRHIQEHLTKNRITLLQLMRHESGLGDYLPKLEEAMRKASDEPFPLMRPEEYLHYADDEIAALEPGQSRYSNVGMLLVGLAIEHAYNETYREKNSGKKKTFDEIVHELIAAPAKIQLSPTPPEGACFNRHPLGASASQIRGNPAGGFWITADDLRKFGEWVNREKCREVGGKLGGKFFELVQQLELYSKEDQELSHPGDLRTDSAFLSTFLDNGVTIAILSDQGHSAASMLYGDIKQHMLTS